MKYASALEIASALVEQFEPYCERVAIAGSIRRGKADVKDIEIVAKPFTTPIENMFGDATGYLSRMNDFPYDELGALVKGGSRMKQILLHEGISLDLFIVLPPAQWGVIYTIRTGPKEFNVWTQTPRREGGAMPSFAKTKDGAVWAHGEIIPMPEEQDFLDFLELGWIEPAERKARWGQYPTQRRPKPISQQTSAELLWRLENRS